MAPELCRAGPPTNSNMNLAITNARVRTMDRSQPWAEAVFVRGNRIEVVGSNEEVARAADASTRVIDGGGATLLPGFNDAHVHFLSGGFSLTQVNLRSAASPEDFVARLRAFSEGTRAGEWILGGDWDHEQWPGSPLPARHWIDAATAGRPVFVRRLDCHMALANTMALRQAGIGPATQAPPGGEIVRDARTGEPTGVLKDAAMELVNRVLPPATEQDKMRAARAATEHAARLGVTSVTDVSGESDLGIYQTLLERRELKTRIYAARTVLSWELLARAGIRRGFGHPMLRIGCVKGFADGSLGSSTALFREPYADAPANRGLLFDQMLPDGAMLERVLGSDRAGLQVLLHAIGDEANRFVLDMYGEVARRNGNRDRRFRIEHAQHLLPEDLPRFAGQKAIASVQPYHLADDGRWCERRIGAERCKRAYSFRSLLDSGAVLAFGSDWTVAPLNPLPGIKAAVTRQTLDGRNPGGWQPQEKLTLEEALYAYTAGSAYAEFAEQEKGSIVPGKIADLVLLDRELNEDMPEAIDRAAVVLTIVDGRVVYEHGD